MGKAKTTEEGLRLAVQVSSGIERKFADWSGPRVGSALHTDDQVWPRHPTSEVARSTLLAGVAHLKGAFTLFDAGIEGPPIAFNSMLRGALIGSSQALWVLGPDNPSTRQARALWLSTAEYRNRSKFHRTQTRSMDAARAEHSRYWLKKWDRTIHEVSQVRAALPTIVDTTTTKQIERVAAEQFAPDEDGHAQLVGAWQSMSSSAHGMNWGLFVRPGMHRVSGTPRGPLVPFTAKPEADEIVDMLVLCARLIGQAGMHLQNRGDV